MAVGWPTKVTYATGDVYQAADVNDTNGTINLLGASVAYAAGKNKIINGDFGVWQRGTSFTPAASSVVFTSDRWFADRNGTGATLTVSRQTFTPGTAPVAGYESTFFMRYNQSVAGSGGSYSVLAQRIEDVRTFAGQTVTFSFWAKAAATTTLPTIEIYQDFGSGGSSGVQTSFATSVSVGTSWTRYTYTGTIPSISGKTIGTGSNCRFTIYLPLNTTYTLDFWGCQLEAGSTATAFQTATGTIQGELAACQRYFSKSYPQAIFADGVTQAEGTAQMTAGTTNNVFGYIPFPVAMRSAATVNVYAGGGGSGSGSVRDNSTGPTITGITVGTPTSVGFYTLSKSLAFTFGRAYGFEYTASAEL
jgi:hypothetical protein